MKILVTVKPVVDVQLKIKASGNKVVLEGLNMVINAWDENALEEAMRLKEKQEAEVVVLTVDKADAENIIRKALAFGADRAIRVDYDTTDAPAHSIGEIIAKVIAKEKPDLVLCGKQAQDTDRGQCALIAAYMADYASVNNASAVSLEGGKILVERLGDEGTEKIEMNLPALVAVSDSINEPRLANIKNIMAARKKPLDVLSLSDLGVTVKTAGVAPVYKEPAVKPAGRKVDSSAEAVKLLMNEAKAL